MSSERRVARLTGIVVGLTIAVLAGAGALLTISHSNSAAQQQRLVVVNFETISAMRQAVIVLQDAEIGERTYIQTGDVADLELYEKARLRVDTVLRQLEASAAEDSDAQRQIAEIRAAATAKLQELGTTINAYRLYDRDTAVPPSSTRSTSEKLRQLAESFIEGQRVLLGRRLGALRLEQQKADAAGLLVLGGAFICLIIGMYMILRGAGRLEDAQEQLSARSKLLQATLETLQYPIFVLDARGTVVAWNDSFSRLAGWDPLHQAALTLDRLLAAQAPITRALLLPLKLDERPAVVESSARVSYDGRDFEVSSGEMPSGEAVVQIVDITDKLRDEAALRQGQKMEAIGQLTGGLAHDFNNILQIVQANTDLMKVDLAGNPAAISRLQSASAAAERGARLTRQLLAFARRQPLAPRPTDVGRLVGDLSGLLRHALGERIALEFAVVQDAWNARIDPGQLENAILNLALNARDAMPDGGTVRVEVGNATLDRRYAALHSDVVAGRYVMIAVEDNGTGMPADVVSKAFDPFFTTKSEGKGTGLGLSMVYGFVRQSNGHVRIDSAIGQGTSVKIYLPRTLDPVVQEPDVPSHARFGNERILVVEDNEGVRRAVVEMLSAWGYRVAAAETPEAALVLLEEDPEYDLLFTDVVMPGTVSAVDLAERARQLRPQIAILLTSGYARDILPAGDRPSYPMLAKPYRAEELAARIRAVLASRRSPSSPARTLSGAVDIGAAPRAGHPRRVLLVEDEVVLRMSTSDMLEKLECRVTAVGSGEQALDVLAGDARFDLLLTDLGLPGMSGQELAMEVRRRYPELPVVIASGYSPADGQCRDDVRFVGKPYSSVDLQQALDQTDRMSPNP